MKKMSLVALAAITVLSVSASASTDMLKGFGVNVGASQMLTGAKSGGTTVDFGGGLTGDVYSKNLKELGTSVGITYDIPASVFGPDTAIDAVQIGLDVKTGSKIDGFKISVDALKGFDSSKIVEGTKGNFYVGAAGGTGKMDFGSTTVMIDPLNGIYGNTDVKADYTSVGVHAGVTLNDLYTKGMYLSTGLSVDRYSTSYAIDPSIGAGMGAGAVTAGSVSNSSFVHSVDVKIGYKF